MKEKLIGKLIHNTLCACVYTHKYKFSKSEHTCKLECMNLQKKTGEKLDDFWFKQNFKIHKKCYNKNKLGVIRKNLLIFVRYCQASKTVCFRLRDSICKTHLVKVLFVECINNHQKQVRRIFSQLWENFECVIQKKRYISRK